MRIKYEVTLDDFLAFSRFYGRHSSTVRRSKIVTGILFPAGLFLLACLDGWYRGRWDALVIGAVMAGLLMLWILGGDRRRVEKALRKMLAEGSNKQLLGEHELELTETGLVERTGYAETTYRWQAVERLGLTPDYIFIFTGAISGIIVPRGRVVEGNHEELEGELRRKVEEAASTKGTEASEALSRQITVDTERVFEEDVRFGKHSGLGVASFVISVVVGGLDLLLFLLAFVLGAIAPEFMEMEMGSVVLYIITSATLLGLVANVAGLGLGIAGLLARNRKKTFSVLGVILNVLILIVLIVLMAIAPSAG